MSTEMKVNLGRRDGRFKRPRFMRCLVAYVLGEDSKLNIASQPERVAKEEFSLRDVVCYGN